MSHCFWMFPGIPGLHMNCYLSSVLTYSISWAMEGIREVKRDQTWTAIFTVLFAVCSVTFLWGCQLTGLQLAHQLSLWGWWRVSPGNLDLFHNLASRLGSFTSVVPFFLSLDFTTYFSVSLTSGYYCTQITYIPGRKTTKWKEREPFSYVLLTCLLSSSSPGPSATLPKEDHRALLSSWTSSPHSPSPVTSLGHTWALG